MKPESDFTTPRKLIPPMSRHFLPVEQPEPDCCTTGLKNGSRLPLIAHFFSSGLVGLGACATLTGAPTTAAGFAATTVFAGCLGSAFTAIGFAAEAFESAAFATAI